MTAPRQWRNPLAAFGLALVLALGAGAPAPAANSPLVVNPETGLALSGYDTVAYFTR